jgi:ABC-2 type transport system ATP-binding protein
MVTSLSCTELNLKVGYKSLLSHFSLHLNAGQTIAITGPNGSGKTSLLKVFAGILRPHQGHVSLFGISIWPECTKQTQRHSFFLSDAPSLLLDQSVLWNFEFYTQAYGLKFKTHFYSEALSQVGLENKEHQIVRTLSMGQKRRLSLAALLLIKPRIVFADEPTNGLDCLGTELCLTLFEQLSQNHQVTFVVATHDSNMINWTDERIALENFLPQKSASQPKFRTLL